MKNFSEFLKVKNGESLQEENKSSSSNKKTNIEKQLRGEKKISVVKNKNILNKDDSNSPVKKKVLNKSKPKNIVKPASKPPVTRFDPREPFQDYAPPTSDRVTNKPVSQTSKLVLGPDGKPLAYKGQNIPVKEPKVGETMIKGIPDADLEQKAIDQTRKNLLKTNKVDTKPFTTTKNVIKKRGPSKRYIKLQKKANEVLKDIRKEKAKEDALAKQKTTIKPKIQKKFSTTLPSSSIQNVNKSVTSQNRSSKVITKSFSDLGKKSLKNISKSSVTTNISKPVKYKGFVDRIMQATGVKSPISKTLAKTDKVTGLSTNDLKNLKGKVRAGGILKGAGRFAGGVFAVKDAYDKGRIEKAKGRSKTSQVLGGIARGAGGYLGAAVGATLGTVAGGGVGSAVLGTGGAIAGYNVGTKVGDYLYKKGRQLATGKKGEAAKVKFKDFMKKIRK